MREFRTKDEVFSYLHRHKHRLAPEYLNRLVKLHDRLPDDATYQRQESRRREVREQLREAWRTAQQESENPARQAHVMAAAVAKVLGDGSVCDARRVNLLYLEAGDMRLVNRVVVDVATVSGAGVDKVRELEARVRAMARGRVAS